MFAIRLLALAVAMGALMGCGLRVPPIDDSGDRVEGQRFVQAILINITCELRAAVTDLRAAYPEGTFLDGFGIQTTLTLTYDEKGALAPGVNWSPPSPADAVFSLGAGLTVSSDATRTNKIDAYYLVSDLQKATCSDESRPNGAFLLQSDLKLSEWLFTAVSASMTNTVNFKTATLAVKDSILQHQVKFVISTNATATPSWTLTRVTVNPSGNFLSLDRTRTNDLTITLGPAVPAVVAEVVKNGRRTTVAGRVPDRRAADLHLSAQIANGIETGVRNALQR
ncbi:hypothetical protein HZZ13_01050 [Bradyrhizobium sp. CNPSo 4010]|uniref:Lipoprotein n=1 Tax=Bradyrhizobium agreste TaxID=2751811 RepID=A0ABS0PGT2_9BRAD|nr:hypothetical protein [Bradyrhizobium agreste]MBH5396404.1 hypothetical protein [Bradyrhizobium agreste]